MNEEEKEALENFYNDKYWDIQDSNDIEESNKFKELTKPKLERDTH